MFRKRRRLAKIFSAGLLLLFTTAAAVFALGAPESPTVPFHTPLDSTKTFTIALEETSDAIIYDVHLASDANSLLVLGGIYEGLYSHDPQTALPKPALAAQASVSADGLHWTFTLRDGIRFSNGDPITANSFLESWLWLLSQSKKRDSSFMASLLDIVRGARDYRQGLGPAGSVGLKTINSHTLEIELVSPAPYLPSLLCNPAFAAVHPSNRKNGSANNPLEIIASGPYVVDQAEATAITLRKQPWYWDYEETASDYIKVRFLSGRALTLTYLERKIDWSQAYIPTDALRNKQDLHLFPEFSTGFFYFSASQGAYAQAKVRQALSLLIPWDSVRDISKQVYPTDKLVPTFPISMREVNKVDSVDHELAFTLLQESGYPQGVGLPTLTMAIHRGSQLLEAAHFIAEVWSKELGLTVVLDVVPLSVYSTIPSQSPYDFAYITWIGDFYDPFAFLHLWSSDSSYNLGNYHNPEFDSTIRQAVASPDIGDRQRLLQKAEDMLLTQGVVFPLAHGLSINIVNTTLVSGWYDNLLNFHPLKYLKRKD